MAEKNEFSLSGLAMPACFSDPEALAKIPRYEFDENGDPILDLSKPFTHVVHESLEKTAHTCMLRAILYCATGTGVAQMRKLEFERMQAVLGLSSIAECVDWLQNHDDDDPEMHEALLNDALKHGTRDDLPDRLLDEYDRRKGGLA